MSYYVYEGQWTDYSRAPAMRQRLTLSTTNSNVLVAGMTLTTIRPLDLLISDYETYIIEQMRRNRGAQDGLHHQLQVLLRNTESPAGFAWASARLSWAWRGMGHRSSLRALILLPPAILLLIASTLASLFLSSLSSKGDVLFRSRVGNFYPWVGNLSSSNLTKWANIAQKAQGDTVDFSYAYYRACYLQEDARVKASSIQDYGASGCNSFVQRYLGSSVSYPGVCPFAQNLCNVPAQDILRLDTGLLDSTTHLGINSLPEDRVQIRRVTTCAPIRTQGYSTPMWTNVSGVSDVMGYFYGSSRSRFQGVPASSRADRNISSDSNATFLYSKMRHQSAEQPYFTMAVSEGTSTRDTCDGQQIVRAFNFSESLRSQSGLVTLVFLSNRMTYTNGPVNDAWFNATKSDSKGFYTAQQVGTVLGCVEERYICNPANGRCVMDSSFANEPRPFFESDRNLEQVWPELSLSPIQNHVALFMRNVLAGASYLSLLGSRGAGLLEASSPVNLLSWGKFQSLALSDKQWQREVRAIENISLANMQMRVVAGSLGPSEQSLAKLASMPEPGSSLDYLRMRVRAQDPSYQSFSVLALSLIFGVQGFIILLCLFIKFVWPYLPHRRLKGARIGSGRQEWAAMGTLQLHRSLYQLLGRGNWMGSIEQIPISGDNELFEVYVDQPSDEIPYEDECHGHCETTLSAMGA